MLTVAWPLLSSVLYGACFPGTWFSLVIFIALTPLFIALRRAQSGRDAFLRGALFGALHPLIIAYWIFNALYFHYEVNIVVSLLFLLGTLSVPFGLLYGVFALVYRHLRRDGLFFHALVVPSLWVVFDFIRELVPLYLPWGLAGYGLAGYPALIQVADITGVHGVTFYIVLVNSLISHAVMKAGMPDFTQGISPRSLGRYATRVMSGCRAPLGIAAVVLAAAALYGAVQVYRWDALMERVPAAERIVARVVQGNFAQRDRWEGANVLEILEASLKLTGDVKADGRRFLVVWPETVLNAGRGMRDALLARLIHDIGGNALLVFGGTRQSGQSSVHNSAYYLSGKGTVKVYDKIILLPFAETTPWGISLLGAFYEAPVRFDAGTLPPVAELEGVGLGFSICFEKIYSWFVRRQAARGATLLVNISNDSWFGRSTNPYQSLDTGILRAVENRRYMIIASNSGISAVVSPGGECVARTGLFTSERADAEVRLVTSKSLYTRLGDIILYAAIIIIAVALGMVLLREQDPI